MYDIVPASGTFTHYTQPSNGEGTAGADHQALAAAGFDWISFLLVDGGTVGVSDLRPYGRASGAYKSVGGWGAVYDAADFDAFGRRFAAELLRQGADHAVVDAEFCAKGTRDGRGLKPIIDAMRAAGWTGPVHLSTLGAPVNGLPHGGNDFGIDVKSFLDTGGGILPQAYFNAYDEYRPDLCVDYWRACGVPMNRLNVTIELAVEGAKMQRIGGAEWSALLKDAGVGQNFSVFMTQMLLQSDISGLGPSLTAFAPTPTPSPTPEPTVENDAAKRNAQIVSITDPWLAEFGPAPLSRMACAHDVAGSTDEVWYARRGDVRDALNGRIGDLRAQLASALESNVKLQTERDAALRDLSAANAKIAAARRDLA